MPTYLRIFLWLTIPVSTYGMWQSLDHHEVTWWKVRARSPTAIEEYAQLRPLTQRALQVDYLMDKTPEGSVANPDRWARIQRRQENTGQRFRAQYALAPSIVYRIIHLHAVRQRAWRHEPYYLILDPAFHSKPQDVLELLHPIAVKRQLDLETHRVLSGYTLVVMKRRGEERLPYWAASAGDP